MEHAYWNDWYRGYTYRAHRRFESGAAGSAIEILDVRYAKGEITRDEYTRMKSEIGSTVLSGSSEHGV